MSAIQLLIERCEFGRTLVPRELLEDAKQELRLYRLIAANAAAKIDPGLENFPLLKKTFAAHQPPPAPLTVPVNPEGPQG